MQIIKKGKLGFCEAYMSGDVTSQNIVDLIEMAVLNNKFIEDKFKMLPYHGSNRRKIKPFTQ